MLIVSYREYLEDFAKFCNKHNAEADCKVFTSDYHKGYHKEYCYDNGATFYEVTSEVVENVEVKIHEVTAVAKVKFFKTEYWSTDNSTSKFAYQVC